MNALILAAGFGTRLGKFGETTPKGLIPTEGTTLIGKVVADLQKMDTLISQKAVITNKRFASQYGKWLSEHDARQSLQFIINDASSPEERLGALGDILYAIQELGWEDDLLILPSDTYYSFSLSDFIRFAQDHQGFSTIFAKLDKSRIKGRLGCAVVESDQVVEFVEKPEKPPSNLAAIPFYFYPAEILKKLPLYEKEGNSMDAPGSIIPWLLAKDIPVYAYLTEGQTLDVGTSADVKELESL